MPNLLNGSDSYSFSPDHSLVEYSITEFFVSVKNYFHLFLSSVISTVNENGLSVLQPLSNFATNDFALVGRGAQPSLYAVFPLTVE